MIRKLTPVVIVKAIEPVLPFYVDALGFVKAVEVPHGDALGFVILVHEGLELMFQTEASAGADLDHGVRATPVCLYLDVDDLDAVIERVKHAPVVVPRRTAPYGADEIFVRDPAGNTIGFAKPA